MKYIHPDIKLFYLSCHNLLKRKFKKNIISRKQLYCELGMHFCIPKNLKNIAIKELEELKLIKREDRDNFIILKSKLNIENYKLNGRI